MFGLAFAIYAVILTLFMTAISALILWIIKKLKYPPKYRWLSLVPMLFLMYGIYQGLASPYSLYEGHFEEITGLELPASTEFIDYDDWGYFASPSQNSSLFHVKVAPEFYEKLKKELNPSSDPVKEFYSETKVRFEAMLGEDFLDEIDFHYAKNDSTGAVLYFIGFIEKDHSLVVHAWKD